MRASWLVWCLYRIYQFNESRCRCKRDVTIECLARAIFEKHLTALHVSIPFIFSTDMCSFCWQKCGPRPKLLLRRDIFLSFWGVHTAFHIRALHCYWLACMRNRRIFIGKSEALLSSPAICSSGGFISHLFGDYANNNMWKSDDM